MFIFPADAVPPFDIRFRNINCVYPFFTTVTRTFGDNEAAFLLDVSHKDIEYMKGSGGIEGVFISGKIPAGVENHFRHIFQHFINKIFNCFFSDTTLFGSPGRSVLFHKIAKFIKAGDIAINKITVICLSSDYFMNHSKGKGIVRSGTYLKKTGGFQPRNRLAHIDIGQFAAIVKHIQGLQVLGNT